TPTDRLHSANAKRATRAPNHAAVKAPRDWAAGSWAAGSWAAGSWAAGGLTAGEGIRELPDVGFQCARAGVGKQIPVGGIEVHDLLAAPGLGGLHQLVVQQLLCGRAFAADRGVAVKHEQPFGVGLEQIFEGHGLAML